VPSGLAVERLYLRQFTEQRYTGIAPLSSAETQRDAAICSQAASLLFLSTEYKTRTNGGWTANGADIWRVDLKTRARSIVIRGIDIRVKRPYTRAFIRELVDVTPKGNEGTVIM